MKTVKIIFSGNEPTRIVLERSDQQKENAKSRFVRFMEQKLLEAANSKEG